MGVNQPERAPAVRRAMAVLAYLAQEGASTAADISKELGLPQSSTSDMVNTMLADGLLRRRQDLFAIGPLITDLAAGFVGDAALLDRFATHWPRHPELSRHTVSIQTILGTQSLCVDVRLGGYLLPFTPRPGSRSDTWKGSVGEPVLTCLTPEEAHSTLTAFGAFTAHGPDRTAAEAWIGQHARGGQPSPLLAKTGNLELNVSLPATAGNPPTVLTLHLPPELGDPSGTLAQGLAELASTITAG